MVAALASHCLQSSCSAAMRSRPRVWAQLGSDVVVVGGLLSLVGGHG